MRKAHWRETLKAVGREARHAKSAMAMWLNPNGQPSSVDRAEGVMKGLNRRHELEQEHPWVLFPLVQKASAPRLRSSASLAVAFRICAGSVLCHAL